ncbi:hypothetical protein [Stieleria varia]|uniref:Uncharacterized protein n=1 Tax=Stieleria varia TaxID=2528005 RepID=A0A5C6B260_9BACT|nr:hypothetical protein [Stieleria varia]TWU04484.1 hypothetical protein Pla52n_25250 [Stieleria varia]
MKKLIAGSFLAMFLMTLTTGCEQGARSTVENAEADAVAAYEAEVAAEVAAGGASDVPAKDLNK